MTLLQKQQFFVKMVAYLILEANHRGYEITFGEAYRSPEEAARLARAGKGIRNSLHTQRLAIDINLFKNGKFLTKSEDYKELGEIWEKLSTDDCECCWGGRFSDGNHFSIAHNGRK